MSAKSSPLRALELAAAEIHKALKQDNTELAMAYMPVVEWAIEELSNDEPSETREDEE